MRAARLVFGAACLALFAIAGWLLAADRLQELDRLGVPTLQPRFADVRPITGASVALAQGIDPLQANPGDPWGRALNYPRIWLLPAALGLGPEHSEALALAFLLAFAAGVLLLGPLAITAGRAVALAAALCSPVTWLAIERANSDLLLFALLTLIAWALPRRPRTAAAITAVAAALKLYPIFALAGFVGLPRRRALALGGALAVAFVAYVASMHADLACIRANSLAWNRISYGITQLPDAAAANTGWSRGPLLVGAAASVALAAVLSLLARRRWRLPVQSEPALHAFRVGAATFIGTFCLGSNFDYRLLCLLLTVPQVVGWCATTRGLVRGGACTLLAALLLLLWSMSWRHVLAATTGGPSLGLVLDELVTWLVLVLLLAALSLSLPDGGLRWFAPARELASR